MDNLDPCPFCGSAAKVEHWHGGSVRKRRIGCDNDACDVSPSVTGANLKVAVRRWNTRLNPLTGRVEVSVYDSASKRG